MGAVEHGTSPSRAFFDRISYQTYVHKHHSAISGSMKIKVLIIVGSVIDERNFKGWFYTLVYHFKSASTISLTRASNEMEGSHFNFLRALDASPCRT
jgi:MFS-type transporter involved in bile tolerance (Atg22 family)